MIAISSSRGRPVRTSTSPACSSRSIPSFAIGSATRIRDVTCSTSRGMKRDQAAAWLPDRRIAASIGERASARHRHALVAKPRQGLRQRVDRCLYIGFADQAEMADAEDLPRQLALAAAKNGAVLFGGQG